MIGRTISHYKVLEKLGEGGMGVVYKAEDTKLKRIVALKFLSTRALGTDDDKSRLIHEAEAAAALTHPGICTVYEIDEVDGQTFIAMEYVEGKTLKDSIAAGPFRVDEALSVIIQVAEGLQSAHEKRIVHRDIKPANIIITSDGRAKIMDFGLAKFAGGTKLTKTGTTVGTVAYMSPEQTRGDPVDHRTDVWSLGVLLYEMLTGQLPFKGNYEQAVVYSILNDEPEPITALRTGVSIEVDRLTSKAMAKRPDERYQDMRNMLVDLRALRKGHDTAFRQSSISVKPGEKSIAVLPFKSLSESKEDEYFSDGTTEDIIAQLSKIGELRVISRTSIMRYRHSEKSIPEIGRELNVATILEGSVRRAGDRVRIVAQLLDAHTDEHMWVETYDRDMKDVFAIQTDVAEKIASALKAKLSRVEKERIERKSTENIEAYQNYLKGRFYWNKRRGDDLRTAIEYFKSAIEIDPGYALAYAGLASTYIVLPQYAGHLSKEVGPRAEAAAAKALELDPTLAEAHAVLGMIKMRNFDWEGTEREFKLAIELNPSYPTARHWYSTYLTYTGQLDEGYAMAELALELDPLSLVINTLAGYNAAERNQYDVAIGKLKKTLELDPNFPPARLSLGEVYVWQGRFDEGIAEIEKMRTVVGSDPYGLGSLGYAYGRAGRKSEAAEVLNELLGFSSRGNSLPFAIAQVFWGLGDIDKTLEWLEKAYLQQSEGILSVNIDPAWDGLRSDPRFIALTKKIWPEK